MTLVKPPPWLAGPSQDEAATGRRAAKALRKAIHTRAVLAQCDRCQVNGTATTDGHRITSLNIATDWHRGEPRHLGCGGRFDLFDIEVDE